MKRWRTFLNAGLIPMAVLALLHTCPSLSLAPAPQTIITTFAGLSPADGTLANTLMPSPRMAVEVSISDPRDIAVDGNGNLFIADTENYRIRQVTPTGTIKTAAGTGPSRSAQLDYPSSVAFDSKGNLFITDSGNNRIRQLANINNRRSQRTSQ